MITLSSGVVLPTSFLIGEDLTPPLCVLTERNWVNSLVRSNFQGPYSAEVFDASGTAYQTDILVKGEEYKTVLCISGAVAGIGGVYKGVGYEGTLAQANYYISHVPLGAIALLRGLVSTTSYNPHYPGIQDVVKKYGELSTKVKQAVNYVHQMNFLSLLPELLKARVDPQYYDLEQIIANIREYEGVTLV